MAGLLWVFAGCEAVPQTQPPAGSGPRVIQVTNAGELQPALDAARPGDTLELTAGATYTGNFRLPAKTGASNDYITIRTSALADLPAGQRVSPDSAPKMAKIISNNADPVLVFQPGSRNWRLAGLEVTNAQGVYAFDLIRVGEMEEPSAARQPTNIEFDRLYVHNGNDQGSKRGFFFNSNAVKLTNSYVSDFRSNFQDAMAVAVCNGPGPYEFTNNFLEGAGYSIIFGGCPNGIPGVAPSDVTFTRNHVFKPMRWQQERWVVKNQFEIKMGRRFRIEGNVFENNWVAGQSGFGILFTVRVDGKDGAGAPFGVIEDIVFANNLVINTPNGINVLGQDDATRNLGQTSKLTIRNNLFSGVKGRLFQFLQFPKDVVIERNTAVETGNLIMSENQTTGFVMRDNIFTVSGLGIFGSGLGSGNRVLNENFPGSVVRNNGFIGENVSSFYPTGNTYVNKLTDVRFVDAAAENYRLQPNSPFRGKAQNNRDPGANMDELEAAIAGVIPPRRPAPKVRAVVNGLDGSMPISPGVLVAVYGESLSNCVFQQPTAPLPVRLCGDTEIRINGNAAPLLYASPAQAIAQVPSGVIAGRRADVQVVTGAGSSELFYIDPENVKPASPAMPFYRVQGRDTEWVFLQHEDGKMNGPLGEGNPLRPGMKAALRIGGLGKTTPVTPDGDVPRSDPPPVPESPLEIYINDTFQPLDLARAVTTAIGMFDLVFTLAAETPIGGLEENWIWVTTQGVESVRRRLQLAPAAVEN
ncbi:MAG: hypothetical protein FJW31_22920 [Acidobacteria bacterium]|nr:hypothetical protein [Acidobacteriota bacterium]